MNNCVEGEGGGGGDYYRVAGAPGKQNIIMSCLKGRAGGHQYRGK